MSDIELDIDIDATNLLHLPRQRIKDCYAEAAGGELPGTFASKKSSAARRTRLAYFLINPHYSKGYPAPGP